MIFSYLASFLEAARWLRMVGLGPGTVGPRLEAVRGWVTLEAAMRPGPGLRPVMYLVTTGGPGPRLRPRI